MPPTLKKWEHIGFGLSVRSSVITARSFKLGQLIEDDDRLIGENLRKIYFIFFKLSPFADLDFENL